MLCSLQRRSLVAIVLMPMSVKFEDHTLDNAIDIPEICHAVVYSEKK
jgi:hypothetical protein